MYLLNKKLLLLIPYLILCQQVTGQEADKNPSDSTDVVNDILRPTSTPVLLFTAVEEKEAEEKKDRKRKRKNKRIYYGEKTRRGSVKQTFRDQTRAQYFHYTPTNRQVNPYVRDVFWYDTKEGILRDTGFNPSKGYLLHGPYEERIEDQVIQTGMFYYGTKHERWVNYNTQNILLDKSVYYEGWPKASRISYYNRADKQIETVTPVKYGLEEGNFYHFYEDGQVAVSGKYKFGEKIGLWTEYWEDTDNNNVRKREVQYQEEPFTKDFQPHIRAEWDQEGNVIYRKAGTP